MPYLDSLAHIRQFLERSACRPWWVEADVRLDLYTPARPEPGTDVDPDADIGTDAHYAHAASPASWNGAVMQMTYSNRTVGELRLRFAPGFTLTAARADVLSELVAQCARMAQRLASQHWTVEYRMGAPALLGSSRPMLALDREIEACSTHMRPVMLLCAPGSEALQTAIAIHRGSAAAGRAFVSVDWSTTLEAPGRWIERARGGTLYLSSLDPGAGLEYRHVWQQLDQALTSQAQVSYDHRTSAAIGNGVPACRLVVAHHPAGGAARTMPPQPVPLSHWRQSDWTCVSVPRLAERREDIPTLTRAVLDYHGHTGVRLTGALEQWCAAYSWPGDAGQLERIVGRMAVLTPDAQIEAADLLRHGPSLLGDAFQAPGGAASPSPEGGLPRHPHAPHDRHRTAPAAPLEHWIRCVTEGDIEALAALPAGLHRALDYLSAHSHEPLSMEQLADSAHVSASHLRFLFRDSLGLSFKLFLQRVRIARARDILLAQPRRRIGEVAASVGFNDASHFQKCFREIIGQSPRELRRSV